MQAALPVPCLTNVDAICLPAYRVCHEFEAYAIKNKKEQAIIYARVLGFLILHAPSTTTAHEAAKAVSSFDGDYEDLSYLGEAFVDYVIRPFKARNRTRCIDRVHPISTSSPMNDDPASHNDMYGHNNRSKVRKLVLIRDGCRCIISGTYDRVVDSTTGVSEDELHRCGQIPTSCVRVVPQMMFSNLSDACYYSQIDYASSILSVVRSFGCDIDNLSLEGTQRLKNFLTLKFGLDDLFETLHIWLERTVRFIDIHAPTTKRMLYKQDVPNQYRVEATRKTFISNLGKEYVTLTTPNSKAFPLPSSNLLALHATCAKIAHLSGVGDKVENIIAEMDDTDVLAVDGSSVYVVRHALFTSSSRS